MENIEFQEIRIKVPEMRIWHGDTEVFPSLTELRLLMLFLSDPYKKFEPEELINRLQLTSRASLMTLIHHLRVRLNTCTACRRKCKKYIVTVPGWGYAFAERSDV